MVNSLMPMVKKIWHINCLREVEPENAFGNG
jgi:hypothetical protein